MKQYTGKKQQDWQLLSFFALHADAKKKHERKILTYIYTYSNRILHSMCIYCFQWAFKLKLTLMRKKYTNK